MCVKCVKRLLGTIGWQQQHKRIILRDLFWHNNREICVCYFRSILTSIFWPRQWMDVSVILLIASIQLLKLVLINIQDEIYNFKKLLSLGLIILLLSFFLPNLLEISELCIFGLSWAIFLRCPLDHTMNAFMGLFMWSMEDPKLDGCCWCFDENVVILFI